MRKNTFTRAAQLMFVPSTDDHYGPDGACVAIEHATDFDGNEEKELLARIFKPDASTEAASDWYWMGRANTGPDRTPLAVYLRARRVWALLLASVAWEDFA